MLSRSSASLQGKIPSSDSVKDRSFKKTLKSTNDSEATKAFDAIRNVCWDTFKAFPLLNHQIFPVVWKEANQLTGFSRFVDFSHWRVRGWRTGEICLTCCQERGNNNTAAFLSCGPLPPNSLELSTQQYFNHSQGQEARANGSHSFTHTLTHMLTHILRQHLTANAIVSAFTRKQLQKYTEN